MKIDDKTAAQIESAMPARELSARIGATARRSYRFGVETDEAFREAATRYVPRIEEWPAFARETFARLYDPAGVTTMPEGEAAPWGIRAASLLEAQASFSELREAAQAAPSIARQATAELGQAVATALALDKLPVNVASEDPRAHAAALEAFRQWREENPPADETADAERQAAEQEMTDAMQRASGRRATTEAALEQAARSGALALAVRDVAARAKEKVGAVRAVAMFGIGAGGDGASGEIPEDLVRLFASNPMFRKILEMAGRMREAANAAGVTEVGSGRCDVVGVVPGDDVARMTPSERVRFASRTAIGLDSRRRILEGTAQLWELRGEEERNRGDVLILCDRSGSMHGDRIVAARGLAAAALMTAQREKRRAVLVMFDHTARSAVVGRNGEGMADALRLLALDASGGTAITAAFLEAAKRLPDLKDPDTLLITDGFFEKIPSDVLARVRGREGRVFAILVDMGGAAPVDFADETIRLTSTSPTGAAIQALSAMTGRRKRKGTMTPPPSVPAEIDLSGDEDV